MAAGTGARAGGFLRLVELDAVDVDAFHTRVPSNAAARVSRGSLSAQGLVAAGCTVDTDWRWVHSLHVTNLSEGDGARPIEFCVERLRDSDRFSTRLVRAMQDGELLAAMTVSFQAPSATRDPAHGRPETEDWPDPHSLPATVAGAALDVRYVDRLPCGPTVVLARANRIWLRMTEELPDRILFHAAAVVYAADLLLEEPLLDPAGPEIASADGVFAQTLDLSMRWHRGFRADDWLRHEHELLTTANGRAVITGRFFSSMGRLVASVSQEIASPPVSRTGGEACSVHGPGYGSRKE